MNEKDISIVNRSSIKDIWPLFFLKKKHFNDWNGQKIIYQSSMYVCMYNQMNKSKVCGVSLRGYLIF